MESLAGDPRYAIRLANEGVWEAEPGFNALGIDIQVDAASGGTDVQGVVGASGTVTVAQSDADAWTRVQFGTELDDAVVVLGPPTANGSQPTGVRVRNVDATGFEMQIDEWDYLDGRHLSERVGWMAIERGPHRLSDGRMIEAGTSADGGGWSEVDLDDGLGGAGGGLAVFTTVASPDGFGALAPRLRDVGADSFEFRLDVQEASRGAAWAPGAAIDWIAIQTGASDGADGIAVGDVGLIDHNGARMAYDNGYDGDPVLLAAMQTTNGRDTAGLRADLWNEDGVRLRVEEETSRDPEVRHIPESVAFLTVDAGPIEAWTGIA